MNTPSLTQSAFAPRHFFSHSFSSMSGHHTNANLGSHGTPSGAVVSPAVVPPTTDPCVNQGILPVATQPAGLVGVAPASGTLAHQAAVADQKAAAATLHATHIRRVAAEEEVAAAQLQHRRTEVGAGGGDGGAAEGRSAAAIPVGMVPGNSTVVHTHSADHVVRRSSSDAAAGPAIPVVPVAAAGTTAVLGTTTVTPEPATRETLGEKVHGTLHTAKEKTKQAFSSK